MNLIIIMFPNLYFKLLIKRSHLSIDSMSSNQHLYSILIVLSILSIVNANNCIHPCVDCNHSNVGNNYTECLQCLSSYYLDNKICLRCLSNCNFCSSNTSCNQCASTFYYNNNQCLPCSNNCFSCSNNNSCQLCSLQYRLQAARCMPCPSNCQSCNKFTCTSCLNGYYLYDGFCHKCPQKCLNCYYHQKCILCSQNNACEFCFTSNGIKTGCSLLQQKQQDYGLVIALIVVFTLFSFVIAFLCICKRKPAPATIINDNQEHAAAHENNQTCADLTLTLREFQAVNNCQWNKLDENIDFDFASDCPICQQKGANTITICRHVFHCYCLKEWLIRNRNCPMCRREQVYYFKIFCDACHYYYIELTDADIYKVKKTNDKIICSFCKFI